MQVLLLLTLPLLISSALTKEEIKGSIGACISGACPPGLSCKEKVCIKSASASSPTCAKPVGTCIDGVCPPGSSCQSGQCCAAAAPPAAGPCDDSLAAGPCMDGQCPSGFSCKGDKCCPQ
ncbi:hypothetical protein PMAYCL1PPCAC_13316 [Pristionchus mayeri]|uniref:CC domain-containing protein n=1 Tax=Pristionchus mayeri TaxID=1317129 RepID=A0AAN4ZQB2_9BILA|nr:hypothetical protein PMAYCL1PPCAC_13316 [Pristionchus mayeri]